MSLDTPYTIKNFIGAPNDVSIMSTKLDKSPALIYLTDNKNVRYTLQVMTMRDVNEKVVHKISLSYYEADRGLMKSSCQNNGHPRTD